MAKTVNLTVRVPQELKQQAEAAADFLDLSISQIVRDAFKQTIERAVTQSLKRAEFAARFAEYGVEAPPATRKQEEEMQAYGIDTRLLSRQQRAALNRAGRSGKLGEQKQARSLAEDMLENVNRMEERGQITKERAAEMRAGFERSIDEQRKNS